MYVPTAVYLRLEEAVEVPEAALDPAVRRHLLEAHVHEDLAELGSHLRAGRSFLFYFYFFQGACAMCGDVRYIYIHTHEKPESRTSYKRDVGYITRR